MNKKGPLALESLTSLVSPALRVAAVKELSLSLSLSLWCTVKHVENFFFRNVLRPFSLEMEGRKKKQIRVPQKEVGQRRSITFFRFQDSFGHFLVTFLMLLLLLRHFFAKLLLPDSFCSRAKKSPPPPREIANISTHFSCLLQKWRQNFVRSKGLGPPLREPPT